jgi:riboflavin biosynthesis protein RibD
VDGATLYVNLEPCAHYGRTPPCVEAIIKARIKRVVIGMKDPNPLTNGKGIRRLRDAGIAVTLADNDAVFRELNARFVKYITQNMPYVVIKAGQSLDGKIATAGGESKWITGVKSREYAQALRDKADAIMVGGKTLLNDDPLLSCRYRGKIKPDKPVKVIVDPELKTPVSARIFSADSPAPVLIAASAEAAKTSRARALIRKGAEIIPCRLTGKGRIDLSYLLRKLAQREIAGVLIEGGGMLVGTCFDSRLVDEVYFFIAPKIIGGEAAVSSVRGKGITGLKQAITLRDSKLLRLGGDFLVTGKVVYNR